MRLNRHKQWLHFIFILFICFWAAHHFYIKNYLAFPWWHRIDNDIDASHVATTIGLLNDSEYTYVYHPGATLFSLHGLIYRWSAFIHDIYRLKFNRFLGDPEYCKAVLCFRMIVWENRTKSN